ncbi:MAG TPA: ATP-binding protein [Xanthobacteraceae bacterium]|nr:ATP-binding protein [Xanthobacteraceae bacterium]
MKRADTSPGIVLILAPHGRDAAVAAGLLADLGLRSLSCRDLRALESALDDDVLFAVITEEAVRAAELRPFAGRLSAQPPWSDLPIIVLTRRGGVPDQSPAAARLSESLGNVTFLERPFHPTTFLSVARAAQKGRQRQFDARTLIEELHEGEESLRTALIAGRLGSWALDLASHALTTTASCKALFGRKPHEGLSYEDLLRTVHPDDRSRMQEGVRVAVETGSDYSAIYRVRWPDGTVRWAEVRARLVRAGEKVRLVGVSSDVTERRHAEDEMRRLNETLEARVAERTAALKEAHAAVLAGIEQRKRTEEQLRQAQKLEMIGQLTGGVAHDFNNLLMVVLGNLELLRKRGLDPKAVRLLDGAVQGAQRGAALTQRLLAFARRQDLRVEPTDLAKLVREMENLLERSVGSQIEIRMCIPDRLPIAMADANQVELALLNLTVNARDAMPNGGLITIELDAVDQEQQVDLAKGRYVRLRVSDTGQGMDPKTLGKATEPFFSTKELGKGTGLGLSMIHGLAVQLNGALRLSSEVGKGTTADIFLPVTSEYPIVDVQHEPVSPAGALRATILVVDDDTLIAMSTVGMLDDLGHDVIEASSGEQALKLLQSNAVDLLITDFSMPGMNGAQLALEARKLNPTLPILLASGYADLPKGLEIALPRIAKPYSQAQIAEEIAKVLSR